MHLGSLGFGSARPVVHETLLLLLQLVLNGAGAVEAVDGCNVSSLRRQVSVLNGLAARCIQRTATVACTVLLALEQRLQVLFFSRTSPVFNER